MIAVSGMKRIIFSSFFYILLDFWNFALILQKKTETPKYIVDVILGTKKPKVSLKRSDFSEMVKRAEVSLPPRSSNSNGDSAPAASAPLASNDQSELVGRSQSPSTAVNEVKIKTNKHLESISRPFRFPLCSARYICLRTSFRNQTKLHLDMRPHR